MAGIGLVIAVAALTLGTSTFSLLGMTNPPAPVAVGRTATESGAAGGSLSGSHPARDPFVGSSSPGIAPHRLSTSPLGSGACSGYIYGSSSWLAYEGFTHTLWVASYPSCVDVFNSTTWNPRFVTTINVGTDPFGVAVDNSTHEVYVTNTGSDNVSVISAVNDTLVATVAVGRQPYGVAFDWRSGNLYVANGGSDTVTVISGANHTVVATVPVGGGPLGVAADPATGQVFVANRWSDNVSIISDATNRAVARVPAGSQPYGVALDNDTDMVYVTNLNSSTITVVGATMDVVLTTIPVTVPAIELQGLAYDSATRLLWVGAGGFWAIAVNTTSQWVAGYSSFDPSGVAYIPDTGDICVTNTDNLSLGCFNWGVPFPTVPLTVHESGLPPGTVWGIALTVNWGGSNSTNVSTTLSSIVVPVAYFGLFPGPTTYTYRVPSTNGYAPTPASGSVSVGNASIWVNVTFSPPPGTFPVVFSETGLSAGTIWAVVLNGTAGSSAAADDTFVESNGTYNFSVRPVGGYSLAVTGGNVTVNGSAVSVTVPFAPLRAYSVIFLETGLFPSAVWGVDFDGLRAFSNTTSLTFYASNGTFPFTALIASDGYSPTPSQGLVIVAGVTVEFEIVYSLLPFTYSLTFNESGLLRNEAWGVSIAGQPFWSTTDQLTIWLPGGSYTWNLASPPSGYWVLNTSSEFGSLHLVSNAWLQITFTAFHTVTFAEVGLPGGTIWNVTLVGFGSGSESTTPWGAWMPFQVLAGNYTFIAGEVAGFTANPASGWVNASWNPTVSIDYVRTPVIGNATYPVTFKESGLPAGTAWTVYFDGVAQTVTQPSIVVTRANGTYGFVVQALSGFEATPSLGICVVAGAPVNLTVLFSPVAGPGTSPSPGPGFTAIALGLGIAGGLIAGTIAGALSAILLLRRRAPRL
ncbi:MAG TPA: YncE family protein [Thermoplasmata archaeon]|nr:YncE family protein [Thermoplasmata archaeon]